MDKHQPRKTDWMSGVSMASHLGVSRRHVSRLVKQGKIEKRAKDGKTTYRTEVTPRVVNLHPSPQSSPRPIKDKGAQSRRSETGSDVQILVRFEEVIRENERLRSELDSLHIDHKALWGVVGDLTTEAINLEMQLDLLKSRTARE